MKYLIVFLTLSLPAFAQQDREAFRAAFEACVSENGLSRPAPGQRPSEEDRQKLDSCLAAKGITRPAGPPRGHRPPPQEVEGGGAVQ